MTTAGRRTRGASGVYHLLLYLYPRPFRDEYGREMVRVFANRCRDTRGVGAKALVWTEAILGILVTAPGEHARTLAADARYAARQLRRSPAYSVACVTTLALAFGASATMFVVVQTVLIRPLLSLPTVVRRGVLGS